MVTFPCGCKPAVERCPKAAALWDAVKTAPKDKERAVWLSHYFQHMRDGWKVHDRARKVTP